MFACTNAFEHEELYDSRDWFLMYDIAPAHTAIIVQQYLAKKDVTCLSHPPYSPDLSPPDYCLFPKLTTSFPKRFKSILTTFEKNTKKHFLLIPMQVWEK